MPAERLQKVLARAGYGSRRSIEAWIAEGRVKVDGHVAVLGERVDPNLSVITIDNRPVELAFATNEVWALHKPVGYVVSASDERRRPTIYELLTDAPPNLRYIGRLDA